MTLPLGADYLPLLLVEFTYHGEEEYEMDHYDLYDVGTAH